MNLRSFSYPIMILSSMFLIIACLSCSAQPRTEAHNPEITSSSSNATRLDQDILEYVNEYRLLKKLPLLKTNDIISGQAKLHSTNMASKKVAFSHDGFEDRVKNISTRLGTAKASAENVAYGKISARKVVDFWLKSPGHRKNIEGKYALTGIGTAVANDGTIFFTQIFYTGK